MTPLEAAARAISPQAWDATFWAALGDTQGEEMRASQASAMRRAKAALEALREPSEGMLRSVDNEDSDKFVARGRAYSAWQAMLTAALGEQL